MTPREERTREALTARDWRAEWSGPPAARNLSAMRSGSGGCVIVAMFADRISLRTIGDISRDEMSRVIADLDAALTAGEVTP